MSATGTWGCPLCTYENSRYLTYCEMCGSSMIPRSSSAVPTKHYEPTYSNRPLNRSNNNMAPMRFINTANSHIFHDDNKINQGFQMISQSKNHTNESFIDAHDEKKYEFKSNDDDPALGAYPLRTISCNGDCSSQFSKMVHNIIHPQVKSN